MELINYTEVIVREHFAEVFAQSEHSCGCDQCKLDILAIALNNLPPKYVVSDKGRIFSKVQSFNAQSNVDVVGALADAIHKVREKPNHQ